MTLNGIFLDAPDGGGEAELLLQFKDSKDEDVTYLATFFHASTRQEIAAELSGLAAALLKDVETGS